MHADLAVSVNLSLSTRHGNYLSIEINSLYGQSLLSQSHQNDGLHDAIRSRLYPLVGYHASSECTELGMFDDCLLIKLQDIKPGNIMIDHHGILKIADFGISIYADDACRKLHRLPPAWYRSPEFLLGDRQYGTSTDVWSLGVVIGELINRHIVFPSKSEIEQILMIYRLLGEPNDHTWPEARTFKHFLQFNDEALPCDDETFRKKFPKANEEELKLLRSLLVMNPKCRATAKQVNIQFLSQLKRML